LQDELDAFLAWKFKSVVGRLGGSGADQYGYPWGAPYTMPVAPSQDADWEGGTGPWFANWGEVARITPYGEPPNTVIGLPTTVNPGDPLDSGYPTSPVSYSAYLLAALAYAVDNNTAGAGEAWERVTAASNFPIQAAGRNDEPGGSVTPRSR
jgi:hypothetical protein